MMITTIVENTTRKIPGDNIPLHHLRRFVIRPTSAVAIRPRMNQTIVAGLPIRNPKNSIPYRTVGEQPKPETWQGFPTAVSEAVSHTMMNATKCCDPRAEDDQKRALTAETRLRRELRRHELAIAEWDKRADHDNTVSLAACLSNWPNLGRNDSRAETSGQSFALRAFKPKRSGSNSTSVSEFIAMSSTRDEGSDAIPSARAFLASSSMLEPFSIARRCSMALVPSGRLRIRICSIAPPIGIDAMMAGRSHGLKAAGAMHCKLSLTATTDPLSIY